MKRSAAAALPDRARPVRARPVRALPDRARPGAGRWRRGFALAAALALAVFAANALLAEVRPGSPWGLAYGTAAALLLLAANLYGLRRRFQAAASRLRLGSARAWLSLHLYGGVLYLLLLLLHSGFALPVAWTVTWWLWALSWWAVASGLAGLALQRWIPRVLGSGLGVEVLYERIPELVGEIRAKAELLVATCSEPVQALYAKSVAPALAAPRRRLIYYLDITGGKQAQFREFDYLRRFLPADEKKKLGELASLYRTKLQIDAHYTLQQALRWWLVAHVPVSLTLLLLLALHLAAVWYY